MRKSFIAYAALCLAAGYYGKKELARENQLADEGAMQKLVDSLERTGKIAEVRAMPNNACIRVGTKINPVIGIDSRTSIHHGDQNNIDISVMTGERETTNTAIRYFVNATVGQDGRVNNVSRGSHSLLRPSPQNNRRLGFERRFHQKFLPRLQPKVK